MDENSLRSAFGVIASDLEERSAVDVGAARRRGRHRLWAARAAVPTAAVALAVAGLLAVPHALSPASERHVPTTSLPPSSPAPRNPPAAPPSFNPLVPYADFGWLPAGFSEGAVSQLWANPFQSGQASLTVGAQSALRTLLLTVNARGTCQVSSAMPTAAAANCLVITGGQGTSRAPDVNGRPAWYMQWGASIAWEYAPNAWAQLDAGVQLPQGNGLTAPQKAAQDEAVRGWVLAPANPGTAKAGLAKRGDVAAAISSGKLIAPSAQTSALLHEVASHVKYGLARPLVFPFRLSGALPSGWRLTSASFQPSGTKLVGTGLSAGPAADPSALSVAASWPDGYGCNFVTGQSSYVTKYGVSWIDRIIGQVNKHVEMLCSTGSPGGLVDGLQVWVDIDENSPGSNAALPGSASLGGAFGVFSRLSFLGTEPTGWTAKPLG